MEFQCRTIVQRRRTSCCRSVENIPLQAERHSARRQTLFAFPPESAFTFRPECCSESQRNRFRFQSGIAFTFDPSNHIFSAPVSIVSILLSNRFSSSMYCSAGSHQFLQKEGLARASITPASSQGRLILVAEGVGCRLRSLYPEVRSMSDSCQLTAYFSTGFLS
jgi:hypothetical protein